MKTRVRLPAGVRGGRASFQAAFTMPRVMIASVIFVFVAAGVISTNFFGLRILEITQSKLGANDYSRRVLGRLNADVQSARLLTVGTGGESTMLAAGLNTLQQGNAIQINTSTNTNLFIRYYWDSTDNGLKRITNGSASPELVASAISNRNVFTAESFQGMVLTNPQNNFVVGVDLQFYEMPNPHSPMNSTTYFNTYRVKTRMARRATD